MKEYDGLVRIELTLNGEKRTAHVSPADTLLRALRENLGMTGTKLGCENGDCGACTLLVDGKPVKSCYTLAVDVDDKTITTIEGLVNTDVQQAFIEEYGFQCGYCTPGVILNAYALLEETFEPNPEETRTWMESNLCRCTGYEGIEKSVKRAAELKKRAER